MNAPDRDPWEGLLAEGPDVSPPDEYVVFLVDVLGMGEKLRRWKTVNLAKPETYGPIWDSVEPLRRIYRGFRRFFSGCEQGRQPAVLGKYLPEKDVHVFRQCTDWRLGTQWFADTFIFYSALHNADGFPSTVPLTYFLMASCSAILNSLQHRTPVRGALCVGKGIELAAHNLFGPAFYEAHYLESTKADYPRIIVSPGVVSFVRQQQMDKPHNLVAAKMQGLASLPDALIGTDNDGSLIVDYLGEGLRRGIDDDQLEEFCRGVRAGYAFVVAEQRRFLEEGNVKLVGRYTMLRHYIESRLPEWGIAAHG